MNIVIAATQVPFVRGGAEVLVEGLAGALEQAGHQVAVVALPFRWYPPATIPAHALAWRLLDVTEANGVPVDRVICTKFPTWAVRHPNKVAWVVHQHRQAYDWYGTPLSDFANTPDDRRVRESIRAIDARGLGECRRVYGISCNVVARLTRFNGVKGASLYPPTTLAGLVPGGPDGGFLLSVARLDAAKRLDLVFRALAACKERVELRVVSDGPDRVRLEQLAATLGITDRVRFLGRVSDAEVVHLYRTCRAVVYAPVDEDYGYAAVEALMAGKPVLTASDSGGVLEFVQNGVNGAVVAPDADALARVLDEWWRTPGDALRLGSAAPKAVANIGWETVVRELTR
ncbi:MAG: glycosyltransferase family 4 protein [Chloroflexota bacterium]|nr:glycosyltransferase family 4 protein [Chloroflexota bacterium]